MIGVSNWGKQIAIEESNPKEAVCRVEKEGKDAASTRWIPKVGAFLYGQP